MDLDEGKGDAAFLLPPPQAGEGRASGFAVLRLVLLALLAFALASPAFAEKGKLRERLTPDVMAVVYPGAERLGPAEGSPPPVPAYPGHTAPPHIFSTPH